MVQKLVGEWEKKEKLFQEQIKDLRAELREAEKRADEAERKRLEGMIEKLASI